VDLAAEVSSIPYGGAPGVKPDFNACAREVDFLSRGSDRFRNRSLMKTGNGFRTGLMFFSEVAPLPSDPLFCDAEAMIRRALSPDSYGFFAGTVGRRMGSEPLGMNAVPSTPQGRFCRAGVTDARGAASSFPPPWTGQG